MWKGPWKRCWRVESRTWRNQKVVGKWEGGVKRYYWEMGGNEQGKDKSELIFGKKDRNDGISGSQKGWHN